jgi:hypothetical protein
VAVASIVEGARAETVATSPPQKFPPFVTPFLEERRNVRDDPRVHARRRLSWNWSWKNWRSARGRDLRLWSGMGDWMGRWG